MSNVANHIRARLIADSAVAAEVSTRVYPGVGPLKPTEQSYIVYHKSDGTHAQGMSGPTTTEEAVYEVTARCTDYADAWDLADAISASLDGWVDKTVGIWSCRHQGERDDATEILTEGSETLVYPVTLTFKLWIQEP